MRNSEVRQPGRPLGEIADAVLRSLEGTVMTAMDLALLLQVPVQRMHYTCYRLVLRKRIRVVDYVKAEWSCRPAALYALVRPLKGDSMKKIIRGEA